MLGLVPVLPVTRCTHRGVSVTFPTVTIVTSTEAVLYYRRNLSVNGIHMVLSGKILYEETIPVLAQVLT
jgi:Na+-translocating ferredoxin:NAD+ oxidoreductase RnfE subunit